LFAILISVVMFDWTDALADGAAAEKGPPMTHRVERNSMLVNGRLREFSVDVPAKVVAGFPPVLAFHGGGGDGDRLHFSIGKRLDALANAQGLLVIYPDAYMRGWNGCRSHAPYLANRLSVDDVAFVRHLLRWSSDRYGTSSEKAFAIGYSSGGHLVYRLALEVPDLLAAASVFAANLPASDALDCRPSAAPVALMIVNGTADTINPYNGGDAVLPDGRKLGRLRSALGTAQYFARLAGWSGSVPARRTVLPPSAGHGASVEEHRWSGGTHPVILHTVHGGGHAIPGSNAALLPSYAGHVERRFDAIGESVRFFMEQEGVTREARSGSPTGLAIARVDPGTREIREADEQNDRAHVRQ
jgi:polyhydroxybutyrate depolymerase